MNRKYIVICSFFVAFFVLSLLCYGSFEYAKKQEQKELAQQNAAQTSTKQEQRVTSETKLVIEKWEEESEELVRNGDFQKKFSLKGTDVAGKTLGIIGLGKIGKEVARKAALGLDMRVISYVSRPEGKDIPEYIEIVSWEELLQTSDYISLHVPGGEKNQGIISKKEFAMMKKSASLIQVSRGGVVDEEALAEAIRNSQIRGAAVDVFSEEPPQKDNPLLKLEQVLLTPHIGSNTVECMDRIALDVAEDVHLVLSGENPKHPIKR